MIIKVVVLHYVSIHSKSGELFEISRVQTHHRFNIIHKEAILQFNVFAISEKIDLFLGIHWNDRTLALHLILRNTGAVTREELSVYFQS